MSQFRYQNRTSKWFTTLIRPILWFWMKRRFRIELKISDEMAAMDGPYVLIGNHVTFWDPFMIAVPLKPDTRFITSDNVFRTPFFRWVMSKVGAIPKTKFVANADIVRRIIGVIKDKGVIGIFPEARRTWDGRTIKLVPQVPKLVHRLKLPVVAARISGGYLSGPRWSRHGRRGKVVIEYSFAVSPEEAGTLDLDEVIRRMGAAIRYNPEEFQKTMMLPFPGRRIAEYLERVLFMCPRCESIATLRSDRDILHCSTCSLRVRYLPTGFLEALEGELAFRSVAQWNGWQVERLADRIERARGSGERLFDDFGARLWTGYMSKPLKLIATGEAELTTDEIVFTSSSGSLRRFELAGIEGANVQNGEKLEFYWNKELYRLDFKTPQVSAYKWLRGILAIQGRAGELAWLD